MEQDKFKEDIPENASQLENENISEGEETPEEQMAFLKDEVGPEAISKPIEAEAEKVQPAEDVEHGWTGHETDDEGGIADVG